MLHSTDELDAVTTSLLLAAARSTNNKRGTDVMGGSHPNICRRMKEQGFCVEELDVTKLCQADLLGEE
jgi:hypothetical protein